MSRVSRKQLEGTADMVNRALEYHGSIGRVIVGARYDYHALDLTTNLDLTERTGGVARTLALGSTGELQRYLYGMLESLLLLEPPYVRSG